MKMTPFATKTLAMLIAGCGFFAVAQNSPKAVTPEPRSKEKWWVDRHQKKLEAPEREKAKIVYIGDSIVHGFENAGKATWAKYYAPRNSLNLGFSGDRTENVLWRLDNGEVDNIKPKLVIMMIGTNNTGHRRDKPADIAAGIKAILDKLHQKLPETKVLLLGIFPRGAKGDDPLRVNNEEANALIEKFADNKNIFYLNINKTFLADDGTLPREIMPDLLHPNAKGYELWAEAIEPTVAKLLGETPISK